MPVEKPNEEYEAHEPLWVKARDCVAGEETIKARSQVYLPALGGASVAQYAAYRDRAMFYSASEKTVTGLGGTILRKPTDYEWPEARMGELENLGLRAESMDQLIKTTVHEVLTTGRVGALVDVAEEEVKTAMGAPYIALYDAEDIINWQEQTIDGQRVVTMIVLRETVDADGEDEFTKTKQHQYRVLRLGFAPAAARDEEGEIVGIADGFTQADILKPFYYQELWVKVEGADKGKDEFVLDRRITPRQNGGRLLNEIPFVFFNKSDTSPTPSKPPLLDLMNVNLSHYRNSADLEHGLHFTALPTPWATGFEAKAELSIGSGVAWVSEEVGAKAGMLEFTGKGLQAIEMAMNRKERTMAVLGARMLEHQKPSTEAADTLRMRASGEQSALSNIAITVSEGYTNLLRWVFVWTSATAPDPQSLDTVSVELNKDFNALGLDSKQLTSLMAAYQGGAISWETWVHNLQRGEVIPDGVTAEEEADRIAAGGPIPLGMTEPEEDEPEPEDPEEPEDDEDED